MFTISPHLADGFTEPHLSWDLAHDVRQLLEFHFMRNAYLAGTIVAVMAAIVGYFAVLRGQTFATHALSQVGFTGASGAALAGVAPLVGLTVFCVLAAAGVLALSPSAARGGSRESAGIGSILGFALALGFLFATLHGGFAHDVYAFLFGTFVGVSDGQVVALAAIAVVVTGALAVIARPLLFASIDADVASARGVPERVLAGLFLMLLALAVAATAQITGTLLVFALVVAPAAAAQQLAARPVAACAFGVALSVAITWLGLALAYFSDYPIGFYVTTLAVCSYALARIARGAVTRARPPRSIA
jgi:zinc/manganese transport system permease protein